MSIRVLITRNPLDPTSREDHQATAGSTLRDLTAAHNGSGDWRVPTVALVNGEPRLRATWDQPIPDQSTVEFRCALRGGGWGGGFLGDYGNVIANVATMGMWQNVRAVQSFAGGDWQGGIARAFDPFGLMEALMQGIMPQTEVPTSNQSQSGSQNYSLSPRNARRMGEPLPVLYGRFRLYPDLDRRDLTSYDSSDQMVLSRSGMISCGRCFVVTGTEKLGDTALADYGDDASISYNVNWISSARFDYWRINDGISALTLDHVSTVSELGTTTLAFSGATVTGIAGTFAGVATGDTVQFFGEQALQTVSSYNQTTGELILGPQSWVYGTHVRVTYGSTTYTTIINGITNYGSSVSVWLADQIDGWNGSDTIFINEIDISSGTFSVTTPIAGDASSITLTVSPGLAYGTYRIVHTGSGGWSNWINLLDPATQDMNRFELDFICPRGLGTVGAGGTISSRSVTIEIFVQGLDTAGAPNGHNVVISRSKSGAQYKPRQWTEAFIIYSSDFGSVSDHGYFRRARIRVRRSTAESTSANDLDTVQLSGARAKFPYYTTGSPPLPLGPDDSYEYASYSFTATATGRLNGDSASKLNAVFQRSLRVWSAIDGWSTDVTATRSIAWALADVLTNETWGCGLTDDQIDLPGLVALESIWSARGDSFDGVFDQTVTAWEALTRIAAAGRAVPVLAGGKVTFVRDGARTVPVALFTQSTIVAGSLSISYQPKDDNEPDGIDATYTDSNTWTDKHLIVALPGGPSTPLRPKAVTLFGITDAAQALREATYQARRMAYQRKTISFTVELDGLLLSIGDMIGLSHDLPAWGQSGELLSAVDLGGGTTRLSLSEPLTLTAGPYYVSARQPGLVASATSTAATPVGGHPDQVDVSTTWAAAANLRTDPSTGLRSQILFGPGTAWRQDLIITSLAPTGDRQVQITCVPYDARIHAAGV